jgi:hypothetical protein
MDLSAKTEGNENTDIAKQANKLEIMAQCNTSQGAQST